MDEKDSHTTTSDDPGHGTGSFALSVSDSEWARLDRQRDFNMYGTSVSAPPMVARLRLFRPADLYNSNTHEEVFSSVYRTWNAADNKEEDEEDEEDAMTTDDEQRDLRDILFQEREKELRELAELTVSQRPADDQTADSIINGLELRPNHGNALTTMDVDHADREQNAASSMSHTHSYPPANQTGLIQDHDRPFADFGDLDRQTISQQFGFNLQPVSTLPTQGRFHAKSFAFTSCTNVPKEAIMAHILKTMGPNKIQYICIGEETVESNERPCVQIQVIFKDKIDRRQSFLDKVTAENCNYRVTTNDPAWNEYIKQGKRYCEFGDFKSKEKPSQRQWPSLSASSAAVAPVPSTPATTLDQQQPPTQPRTTATKRPATVRGQAEERRKREDDTARHALALAEESVDNAMDFIRAVIPNKFLQHSKWYADTFKYVRLRAQHETDRSGTVDKEYAWPNSFPECTPELRAVVERWIQHHFFRVKRAKCLVLIGPTGTGKTSFALSLPGRVNYFQGRWNLDNWSDYARYSVYDDIPWDEFEAWNYPFQKSLLTQNGKIGATDKYRGTSTINVRQPAIVLMNPENAGSLLAYLTDKNIQDKKKRDTAAYWKKRATVYVMGPREYFYRRHPHSPNSASTNSSMSPNEPRFGGPAEFDVLNQRHREQQDLSQHKTNEFDE